MTDGNRRNWWLLALGLVVASLVFAVVAKLVLEPEATRKQSPPVKAASRPAPTAAVADALPTARVPPPVSPSEARKPDPVESASLPAECARSADCRSPKTADCIVASCEVGRCVFDRSGCECSADDECDDGVECTRDLCFGATKKCIHIRSACK